MASNGKKSLLIVDDDEDILTSLGRLVQRTMPGVVLHSARSAAEALAVMRAHPVDAIVSDFRMAETDGIEFLQKARQLRPSVIAIMMTAYPNPRIAQEAVRRAGVVLLVTKPFDPEAFVQVIRTIGLGDES